MKIILSRKGFDSSFGRYPSLIYENKLISLPIPSYWQDDINGINEQKYSEICFNEKETYFDLMHNLDIKCIFEKKKPEENIELTEDTRCHFDPNLKKELFKNPPKDWKPAFGQGGAAETHLENKEVGIGDLFLFFGWFKKVEKVNNQLTYTGPDLHVIWGYLQIGEIKKINQTTLENMPKYLNYHSHAHVTNIAESEKMKNTIYVARDNLTFLPDKKGAGILDFDQKLVLTKDGDYSRTKWQLPQFFKDQNIGISYHKNETAWKNGGEYFQSQGRGQEFVINNDNDSKELLEWVKSLVVSVHPNF